ncbi:MAG: ABC transporter permease [Candidatus Binatia bacterium]
MSRARAPEPSSIPATVRRALAFLERDAAQQLSYRAALLLEAASILIVTTMFFFLARVVDPAASPFLERYGSGYFAFALTGIALSNYLSLSLHGFGEQIRQGQVSGTLEALFLTPARSWEIVAWGSLWSFAYQSLKIAIYLAVGVAFGLSLESANWPAAVVVLLLSIFALAPFGILAAAFILVWKKGDPISYFFTSLSTLLAGVYYPVEVLPEWLQGLARLLPLTHAVEGFRASVLRGAALPALAPQLLALGAFAIVLIPPAFLAFSRAAIWAKRAGGLGQY